MNYPADNNTSELTQECLSSHVLSAFRSVLLVEPRQNWNQRPLNRKSDALPTAPPSHLSTLAWCDNWWRILLVPSVNIGPANQSTNQSIDQKQQVPKVARSTVVFEPDRRGTEHWRLTAA